MSKNVMLTKEAGKALGDMLKANSVLKELDVSSNYNLNAGSWDGAGFALGIADGLSTNGALKNLNISSNGMEQLVMPDGWTDRMAGRTFRLRSGTKRYCHKDGRVQDSIPEGSKPEGFIALANAITSNGALVTVNVMGNSMGKEQLSKLQEITQGHPTLISLCGIADDATEADLSGLGMDADDAAVLADELPTKGALEVLNMSNNNLVCESGWIDQDAHGFKEGDMVEHEGVQSLVSSATSFSYKVMMMHGLVALADAISTSGAMTKFDISANGLYAAGAKIFAEALSGNKVLTEVNISSNSIGHKDWRGASDMSGVIAIGNAIPTIGAIENLHIGSNGIPADKMHEIMAMCHSKPSMKVLCGVPFKDKTITELDVSGKNLGVEGAVVVSNYIENNGAMTSLNVSNNNLGGKSWDNRKGEAIFDLSGIRALAAAIPECK